MGGHAKEAPSTIATSTTGRAAVPALPYRTWTSISGDTIEAAFINLNLGTVVLSSHDQNKISIPLERLQWTDQIYARRLHGQTVLPIAGDPDALRDESDSRVTPAFGSECETLLIHALSLAENELLVAIYTFTSQDIQDAIIQAADRGVQVSLKYDESKLDTGRMAEIISALKAHKNIDVFPVDMPGRFASMHHKFAVMDRSIVFTGSFNFTVTASTRSYENAVMIRSLSVAEAYIGEFEAIDGKDP